MQNKNMKTVSIDKLVDTHIGTKGKQRDEFGEELRLDILGVKIKELRKSKKLNSGGTWRINWCQESSDF